MHVYDEDTLGDGAVAELRVVSGARDQMTSYVHPASSTVDEMTASRHQ